MVICCDGECSLPGADLTGQIIPDAGVGIVLNTVENNNLIMKVCKGTAPNGTDRAQTFREFRCLIELADGDIIETFDTRATVSASGQALATCFYRIPED
jgi:hypothetical protein